MRLITLIVLLGLVISPAHAAENTGNDFLPACKAALARDKNPSDPRAHLFQQGFCAGLVTAMFEGGKSWCAPEEALPEQGLRVVVNYIEKNPNVAHNPFIFLMAAAFLEAWPCKK